MEEEEKEFIRKLIIPAVMFVFYLGLFIWLVIVDLINGNETWMRFGEELLIVFFIFPAFAVIINLVTSIKYKSLSYSLGMAGLNSFFCLVWMSFILGRSLYADGFVCSVIMLGVGVVTSGIVLSIIYIYKKIKKI